MSSQDLVSIPLPKPKIFRPPPALADYAPKQSKPVRSGKKWRLIALLVLLGLLWPPLQKATAYFTSHNDTKNADMQQGDHDGLAGVLQPPVDDAQASVLSDKSPTIMLRGQSEGIVGQMARIPSGSVPIVEMRAASNIDNNTARELLSIVSKY